MKKVTILGSTGSIGTQTLDVMREHRDMFSASSLTCGKNIELLAKQIEEWHPALAVTGSEADAKKLRQRYADTDLSDVAFDWGTDGMIRAAEHECDVLVNSVTGIAGLVPTYHAICAGHDIALANKETLVAGGSVIMDAVREHGVRMLPVDSEHSAIFQCLEGNRGQKIKRILLTASGGPFRGCSADELKDITPEQALKHPNWHMGKKVTIDSATLMNKGFECIEAKWLFGVDIDDIKVLVHPQSIVHSAVEFEDTAVMAQLGTPDMRIPISVALGYPDRLSYSGRSLDLTECGGLTFEEPDTETFRCLPLAIRASREGGTYPAALNGANEVLVQAFLDGRTGFPQIADVIEAVLDMHSPGRETLDDILEADRQARADAALLIDKYGRNR